MRWASTPPRKTNSATETPTKDSELQAVGEQSRAAAAMPSMKRRGELKPRGSSCFDTVIGNILRKVVPSVLLS